MKQLGMRALETKKVEAGVGFEAKLSLESVSKLVHILRTHERPDLQMRPIVVRSSDNHCISGEDVLAAHVVLGSPMIRVMVVEVDEEEFTALRVADEARIMLGREAQREAELALIDKLENRAESERAVRRDNVLAKHGVDPGANAGTKKTTRGAARSLAASLLGTTEDALRKSESRRLSRNTAPAPKREDFKLECYGNVCTAQLLVDAKSIMTAFAFADVALRNAQREVTRVKDTRLGPARYTRAHEAVHHAAELVRSYMPSHLCPWCKDVATVRAQCAACWSSGYVSAGHFASAPEELRELPCVSYGGQYVDQYTLKPYQLPAKTNEAYAALEEPTYDDSEAPPAHWDTEAEFAEATTAFPAAGATSPLAAEWFDDEPVSGVIHVDELDEPLTPRTGIRPPRVAINDDDLFFPPDPTEDEMERIRQSCEDGDEGLEPDPYPSVPADVDDWGSVRIDDEELL